MKQFTTIAAQGEITLIRIGDLPANPAAYDFPKGFSRLALENGMLIIGHSETGHHHVMEPEHVRVAVMDRPPQGMRILNLIVSSPTPIVHLREFDTHEPIMVEPGIYQARIAREFDPYAEVARIVAD